MTKRSSAILLISSTSLTASSYSSTRLDAKRVATLAWRYLRGEDRKKEKKEKKKKPH
jgi:hypothetical protein